MEKAEHIDCPTVNRTIIGFRVLIADLTQVHSLTEFQRNAKDHIERLKETGKPEVLTINGQAEVVVQSAKAYQELLDDAELARSLRVIRKSLEDAKLGKTRPAKDFLKSLATQHGIDLGK